MSLASLSGYGRIAPRNQTPVRLRGGHLPLASLNPLSQSNKCISYGLSATNPNSISIAVNPKSIQLSQSRSTDALEKNLFVHPNKA